jgi:hypothetical protein
MDSLDVILEFIDTFNIVMQHASAAYVCSLRITEALVSVYKASLYAFQVACVFEIRTRADQTMGTAFSPGRVTGL